MYMYMYLGQLSCLIHDTEERGGEGVGGEGGERRVKRREKRGEKRKRREEEEERGGRGEGRMRRTPWAIEDNKRL